MERTRNELFKYIPFRLYFPDYTYIQKTVKPCTTKALIFCNHDNRSSKDGDRQTNSSPVYSDYDTLLNKAHKCSHNSSTSEDQPKKETSPDHRYSTILDLIQVSFTNRLNELLLPLPSNENKKEHEADDENENEEGKDESESEAPPEESRIDVNQFKYRFITHGIEIPFDTPLQWLTEHFSYPDNFLHICAVLKEDLR